MIIVLLATISLSLDDVVERALRNSPVYLESKKNYIIQQKTNSFVYSSLLPSVSSGYDYSRSHSITSGIDLYDTTSSYNLSASWELNPTDFLDAFSTHWKNSSVYYSFLETRDEVIYQVIGQYLNTLMFRDLLLSKDKAVQRTENNMQLVKEKLELGSASRAELLKSRVDHLQARYEFLRTSKEERVARLNLKKLIGVEPVDSIKLIDPEISFELPDKDSIIANALENDPTLNMYRAEVNSAQMDLISNTANQFFTISFQGNYGYRGEQFPSGDVWDNGDNYYMGISISVPIFTGFSRVNQIMISRLRLSLSEMRLNDREREIKIDIEDAYLEYQESLERIELTSTTLELAEESYRAAEERYRLGEASIIELLGAEEDLLQAQYSSTQALFDHYLSIFRLRKIMGRLP